MAKAELNWTSVQATSLTGDMLKAWDTMKKAQDTFKQTVIANARRAKAIQDSETLALNLKPWGFGMAKASTKQAVATAKAGALFSNL